MPKIEPCIQMQKLKQALLLTPKNERKEILDKGMEISRQRRKVAALKQEREELLKDSKSTTKENASD